MNEHTAIELHTHIYGQLERLLKGTGDTRTPH